MKLSCQRVAAMLRVPASLALPLRRRRQQLRPRFIGKAVALAIFLSCGHLLAGESNPVSVILISVDTLRADHLSCYGYRALPTPHIDAMTAGGAQFWNVNSQVPLTLPSHVSLLTSTYPFSNGVEDNGEVLPRGAVTLASLLGSRGYRTAAFVGGFTLDRRFGLDQGFDVYDSPFNLTKPQGTEPLDVKRPARKVTHAARQWLQSNLDRPFFLFVHLYDLHKPYALTPDVRARFRGREYDGMLSYVDTTLGDFWSFLASQGLVDKCLIIFLSDHGESLGEHVEQTHGYFIYQSTLRVPLIFHWPRESRNSKLETGNSKFVDQDARVANFEFRVSSAGDATERVDYPAGLIDVAPTILQFLGISQPPQFQGRSLMEMLKGGAAPAPRGVYSESLYAHYHYGCAALRSLRQGSYVYINAPRPEFYDLTADPAEQNDLYAGMSSLALAYGERLQSLRSRFATAPRTQSSVVSPEVARALSSLGYVAATSRHLADADSGPDPKARVEDYLMTEQAVTLSLAGQLPQSIELLKEVLAKDPDLIDTRTLLGLFAARAGRPEEAAEAFRRVLERDSAHLLAHYNLGVQYFRLRRLDDAVRELQATVVIGSSRGAAAASLTQPAEEMLGKIWLEKGDRVRARQQYEHLLSAFPRDFAAHFNLGWIASEEKNWEEASRQLHAALEIEPDNSQAHCALGTICLRQGDFDQARLEFGEAVKSDSKSAEAHYGLGVALGKLNKRKEAAGEFREALQIDPGFLAAQKALEEMR